MFADFGRERLTVLADQVASPPPRALSGTGRLLLRSPHALDWYVMPVGGPHADAVELGAHLKSPSRTAPRPFGKCRHRQVLGIPSPGWSRPLAVSAYPNRPGHEHTVQSLAGRLLARRERLEWFRRIVRPSSLRMRQPDGSAVRSVPHDARGHCCVERALVRLPRSSCPGP